MKPSIIVFPGSNCDRDVSVAIKNVLGFSPKMIWHKETSLEKTSLIVLPGGFSHGDYLRSGSIIYLGEISNVYLDEKKEIGESLFFLKLEYFLNQYQ